MATAVASPARSSAPAPCACPAELQRLCGWVGVGNAAGLACPHPQVARAHHIAARRTALRAYTNAASTHTAPMAIVSTAAFFASSAALAMVERAGAAAQQRPAAPAGAVPPDELHHARAGLSGALSPHPLRSCPERRGETLDAHTPSGAEAGADGSAQEAVAVCAELTKCQTGRTAVKQHYECATQKHRCVQARVTTPPPPPTSSLGLSLRGGPYTAWLMAMPLSFPRTGQVSWAGHATHPHRLGDGTAQGR